MTFAPPQQRWWCGRCQGFAPAPVMYAPPPVMYVAGPPPRGKGLGALGWSLIAGGVLAVIVIGVLAFRAKTARDRAEIANAMEVTPQELAQAYEANEVAAEQRYRGKMVRIRGTIFEIGRDLTGDPTITLDAGDFFGVECTLEDDDGRVADLVKGEPITLHGRVDQFILRPALYDCAIED